MIKTTPQCHIILIPRHTMSIILDSMEDFGGQNFTERMLTCLFALISSKKTTVIGDTWHWRDICTCIITTFVTFAGETLEALDLVTMTAGSSDRVCGMRVTHRVCVIVWSLGEMFCLHNCVLVMFEELIMKLEKKWYQQSESNADHRIYRHFVWTIQ